MMTASNGAGTGLGPRNSGPFTPIVRQASIYSLTLDELQNTYEPGKNFGSMNMDEFLKNIWTAEESHAMAVALASTNESNNPQPSSGGVSGGSGGLARQASFPRQVSLPRTLSRKTVDEVWKDIQRGSEIKAKEQQKEMNYGEMTLEDFLAKAGVGVREEGEEADNTAAAVATTAPVRALNSFPFGPGGMTGGGFPSQGAMPRAAHHPTSMEAIAAQNQQQQQSWLSYQFKTASMQQHHYLQQQAEAAAAAAAFANATKRGGQPLVAGTGTSSGSGMEGSSDGGLGHGNGLTLSPAIATPETPTKGKKRNHEGVVEKTVERRQRRMIKNRESAARSRARKQAYTVELEAEVTQLKEENLRLKQQQVLDNRIPPTDPPPPKKVLRRTKTNPW